MLPLLLLGPTWMESWDVACCLSLTGPSFVTGTVGSSLTVRCRYDQAYKGYNKYWCRGEYDTDCHTIVETKGEEREERNGWVSIRDSADDLAFTVTMKNLDTADAGPYWCKIQTVWILDAWSRDPSFQVQVSVSPAPPCATMSHYSAFCLPRRWMTYTSAFVLLLYLVDVHPSARHFLLK
ncbi:CMRF35-like molecule 2 [Pteropus alecto]|uniref:CMRF35-like molecule 2 n=1 Tax=Pteropus alecto TaxID=9402 RepID=L5KNG4_PTEAL|nr:CMRF35-like molecule 2 [Pteropus alecto]